MIKKIAIIGAGPAGLAALNEFLHTARDSTSTISKPSYSNEFPSEPAFEEIIVFERNNDIGGVWNYRNSSLSLSNSHSTADPWKLRPAIEVSTPNMSISQYLQWNSSAAYEELYTNVPNEYMRYSSGYDLTGHLQTNRDFQPFLSHKQVLDYLHAYVDRCHLRKHIKFNHSVEKLYKEGDKWYVVSLEIVDGEKKWHSYECDAVLVASGKFNVPFIPPIKNLEQFIEKHPGVVVHSKNVGSVRRSGKEKVLVVGDGVSAVDMLQYLIPSCKKVWLSRKTRQSDTQKKWHHQILEDKSLKVVRVPQIDQFEGDEVVFNDGSRASGFDRLILATGYHYHYPFLSSFSSDSNTKYISISGTFDGPKNQVSNLILHSFTAQDPSLCHLGLSFTPFFFLTAEATASAISGVWSGGHEPPTESTVFDEQLALDYEKTVLYIKHLQRYWPRKRFDILSLVENYDGKQDVLKELFYKVVACG